MSETFLIYVLPLECETVDTKFHTHINSDKIIVFLYFNGLYFVPETEKQNIQSRILSDLNFWLLNLVLGYFNFAKFPEVLFVAIM
jgi:hypothetical protein